MSGFATQSNATHDKLLPANERSSVLPMFCWVVLWLTSLSMDTMERGHQLGGRISGASLSAVVTLNPHSPLTPSLSYLAVCSIPHFIPPSPSLLCQFLTIVYGGCLNAMYRSFAFQSTSRT